MAPGSNPVPFKSDERTCEFDSSQLHFFASLAFLVRPGSGRFGGPPAAIRVR